MSPKQNELIAALEKIEGVLEQARSYNHIDTYDRVQVSLEIARNALVDVAEDLQPSLTMKHCLRCGHDWYPKSPGRPKVCPRPRGCGSLSWDKEWDKHSPGPRPRLNRE